MAAIYLIRHGQASFNSENYDQLSELGFKQAQALGAALKQRGLQFDSVYQGTMKRHEQTAQNCLEAMGCSVQPTTLKGLNEYNHEEVLEKYRPEFGSHGQLAQFLASQPNPRKAFQIEFENAFHRWRSGEHDEQYSETWNQFHARCKDALQHIRNHCGQAKSIAVFSSGGPISAITGHCLELTDAHIAELSWSIMNCAVTSLLFNAEKLSLRYFNDFSHFELGSDKSLLTYR